MVPSDMPAEYGDYGFWNKPYFLSKAERVGPQTKALIQQVIEKFAYPVQSFRSCVGILRFAERYGNKALEGCCQYIESMNKRYETKYYSWMTLRLAGTQRKELKFCTI